MVSKLENVRMEELAKNLIEARKTKQFKKIFCFKNTLDLEYFFIRFCNIYL